MNTVGSVLRAHKGNGPGFGLMRLLLAILVIFVHSDLVDGAMAADRWWPYGARWALANFPVPMFFVVSGFLVTASIERSRIDEFLVNRLVRLVPALVVVVLVTALVLGPLVTQMPAAAYFHDRTLYSYLLTAIGLHRDALPGVFTGNPEATVNGSLWTLPHEVSCYLLLCGLALSGALRRRGIVLVVTIGLYGAAILLAELARAGIAFPFDGAADYVFVERGAARLVPLFLTGALFYQYRASIPSHAVLAALAATGLVLVAVTGNPGWQTEPLVWAITAPMFAYLAVYLGLASWFVLPILAGLDYSYGIFLYGFPVQQTLVQLMPGFGNYPLFFLLSLVPTVALAALSWHLVESPALRQRRRLRDLVVKAVDRVRALRPAAAAQAGGDAGP